MIQFFRFSSPLQVGVLLLLIALFRLPLLFTHAPLLWENLYYFTISHKIANGAWLYKDIIDTLPPLTGLIFGGLHALFGASKEASVIVCALLVVVQAVMFARLCNQNDILTEKGMVPALMYVLASFTLYDFAFLSPAVISNTFLLAGLHSIFKHVKSENNEGEIFTSAAFLGLAYLSLPITFLYFLLSLLTFLLYTRTSPRQYLLFFTGFAFPIMCVGTYFYLYDAFVPLCSYYFFNTLFTTHYTHDTNLGAVIFILLPVVTIVMVGMFRSFGYRRFIIYQAICQRLMFIWLLVLCVVVGVFLPNNISVFFVIVSFVAFFMSHFFLLMPSKKWGTYIVIIYLFYVGRVNYSYIKWPYIEEDLVNFNGQVCEIMPQSIPYKNKKVWVIGHNPAWYVYNTHATPFYHWPHTQAVLGKLDTYPQIIAAYKGITTDLPEIIVDEAKLMPLIFDRIPALRSKYMRLPQAHLYALVP